MFWLVVVIIVIVVIVHNNNKKKKQQQSGQQPTWTQQPPQAKGAGAPKAAPTKPGAPPQAGDPIDQAAFARAFAHMSGEDSKGGTPKPEPVKTAPVKSEPVKTAPKAEPKKSSAPPKAGDPIDQAAFARAFAHMSGDAPKGESPKAAPAKPEPPEASESARPEPPKTTGADEEARKQFQTNILGYYHSLWNRDTGSLYTELASMPIHHFGVQVRADRLVESVWLEGDEIPLVNDTEYTKLCSGDASAKAFPLSSQQEMDQLYGLIRDYLLHLGTVELRGDYFYPLQPGQAPSGQSAPEGTSTGGKAAQAFSQADKDAQLRAQVQALLEKQKKDKPPKQ